MTLTVKQRARRLAAFRFIEVRLMETLARWIPSTPEMEAKILFGQHIWDHAQHADSLGRRAHELRAPLHHTLEPGAACLEGLNSLDGLKETPLRLHAYYGVVLGALETGYRAYLDDTDLLMDAPSVRAVTAILMDMTRMEEEHRRLLEELPGLGHSGARPAASLHTWAESGPGIFLPAGGESAGEAG